MFPAGFGRIGRQSILLDPERHPRSSIVRVEQGAFPFMGEKMTDSFFSPLEKDALRRLAGVYRSLARQIRHFRRESGLSCPMGCGQCCEEAVEVEASVFEMLPAAGHLFRAHQAEIWREKAQEREPKDLCIFYEGFDSSKGKGHCRIYPRRPLVCRLHGYAVRCGKNGRMDLMACCMMKTRRSKIYEETAIRIASGHSAAPVMTHYSYQVEMLNPLADRRRLPINDAFKTAVEYLGLKRRLRLMTHEKEGVAQGL